MKGSLELGGFVLAHAIWKADGEIGEDLVSFSMLDIDGQRRLEVYATGDLGLGVELGKKRFLESRDRISIGALAYVTVTQPTGEEAITVDIWHEGGFQATLRQGYRPKTRDRPFALDGEIVILIQGRKSADTAMLEAVFAGIDSHPEARGHWGRG